MPRSQRQENWVQLPMRVFPQLAHQTDSLVSKSPGDAGPLPHVPSRRCTRLVPVNREWAILEELGKLLDARKVPGDPIERDGVFIAPIVSYGFALGAGGGEPPKGGPGAGTADSGGIKPPGPIVIDRHGARAEGIKGAMRTLAEVIGKTAAHAMDRPETGGKGKTSQD